MDKKPIPVFIDPDTSTIEISQAITNNDNPPLKRGDKTQDPDPLSRICLKAKKELYRRHGVTVCYVIKRITDIQGANKIEINFLFSNTGPNAVSYDDPNLPQIQARWEDLMAARCADLITSYLDGTLKI